MSTWTTQQWIAGEPEAVVDLLTEPEAIARWSPLPFEVLDLIGDRLDAGTHARVSGSLAGRRLCFDVDVREASSDRLTLTATGAVSIHAMYQITSAHGQQRPRDRLRQRTWTRRRAPRARSPRLARCRRTRRVASEAQPRARDRDRGLAGLITCSWHPFPRSPRRLALGFSHCGPGARAGANHSRSVIRVRSPSNPRANRRLQLRERARNRTTRRT